MTDTETTILQERLAEAEQEAAESHRDAMNSYGAGYDRGYADALKWVLNDLPSEIAIRDEEDREERFNNGPFGVGA